MIIPKALALMRAEGRLNVSVLIFMDFVGDPHYMWMGAGNITTPDGQIWKGIGEVVAIKGGAQGVGLSANNATLTITATDDMITKALAATDQVYNRVMFLAVQFFDKDWQPIDAYQIRSLLVMDQFTFAMTKDSATLTLNCEHPFIRRRTPNYRNYSSADQNKVFPNDRLFDGIPDLVSRKLIL
jgi:hypothetical protein